MWLTIVAQLEEHVVFVVFLDVFLVHELNRGQINSGNKSLFKKGTAFYLVLVIFRALP